MKSRYLISFVLVWLSSYHPAHAWTGVGPGIEYQKFTLSDPNNVFVARMDRHNSGVILESSIGQGRLTGGGERVSDQADRYDNAINYWFEDWGRRNDVVVAINGDFYNVSTGIPHRGQVHSGWFAKEMDSLAFAWTARRALIISTPFNQEQIVTYADSGTTQEVNGINQERGDNQLIVYTPQYDQDTNTDQAGSEVLVEMGRPNLRLPLSDPAWGYVTEIRQNQGSTPIPFDHVVLSASGTAATTLLANVSEGARIGLSLSNEAPYDGEWTKTYASVGGEPLFLWDGEPLGGSTTVHPRTAVAYNDDYIFFVVVDGRDSGTSVGMDMTQLGNFCDSHLSAEYGLNLDGGGSSTLVVNGTVMNNPSDGQERSVANGLMMVAVQPKLQSTVFNAGDQIKTTNQSNVRLGPGTNYAVVDTVPNNTPGVILDHSLRGVYAKGYYWWKCDFGSTVGWVADSLVALVATGNLPTITAHPSDVDPCEGSDATFHISASGQGAPTYQWQAHAIDLCDDGRISGSTTPTLLIANVDEADVGSYRCVVGDDNGTVTSHSAALMPPRPEMVITQQPESLDAPPVRRGSDVSFTVAATGEGILSYQWEKDGSDLDNNGHYVDVTTPTLTIYDVNANDEGAYSCWVTTDCGSIQSNQAWLKVVSADFDDDNDVDLEDFGHLQACLTGRAVPQTDPGCWDARLDADEDIDGDDVALFRACLSGAALPMDPACLD